MAVTRHTAGGVASTTTSTVAPTYPTNSVGDVLLLGVITNGTAVTPSGWTLVGTNTTNTSGKVYVYWLPVTTVLSGTLSITCTGATGNRASISSYSGSDTSAAPTDVVTNGASSTTTAVTAPSQTYAGGFVYWFVGFSTGSVTFSGEASSSGSWVPSEASDTSGSALSSAFIDGAITVGATASLSGTASKLATYGTVAVSLLVPSAFSASPALPGTGTLTTGSIAAGTTTTPALTGTGTLTSASTITASGTPALSGAGALTVTPIAQTSAAVGFGASGALTVAPTVQSGSAPGLSGAGALTVAPSVQAAETPGFTGSGALAAAIIPGGIGSPALSGTGTLTAVPQGFSAAPSLTGSGGLSLTSPVPNYQQSWDGGSGAADGVAITAANTAGPGNTAVGAPAGSGSATFSATHVHSGSLAAHWTVGVSQPLTADVTVSATQTVRAAFREYFYFPAASLTTLMSVIAIRSTSSARLQVATTTTGFLTLKDANGTIQWTSASALTADTWLRIEVAFTPDGTTTGSGQIAYFLGDSLTPVEDSGLISGVNFGSGAAFLYRFGTATTQTTAFNYWRDDWAFTSSQPTGYIGPQSTAGAPGVAVSPALPGSGALTAGTVANPIMAAGFSGSGALTTATIVGATSSPGFTGAGALSAAAVPGALATPGFGASGTLSSAVTPGSATTPAFTAAGVLAAAVGPAVAGTASLTAAGTLTSSAAQAYSGTPAFSGTGVLSDSIVPNPMASLSFTGSGVLSGTGSAPALVRAVAFTGAGALSSASRIATAVVVNLSGSGTLTAAPIVRFSGAATLGAAGVLTVPLVIAGERNPVFFTGDGLLDVASAPPSLFASVALGGAGALAVLPSAQFRQALAFLGFGELDAVGVIIETRSGWLADARTRRVLIELSQRESPRIGQRAVDVQADVAGII